MTRFARDTAVAGLGGGRYRAHIDEGWWVQRGPNGVPTIDLTVHFRQAPSRQPGWALVRFRTTVAAEGYVEEDGEAWSADGRLLAQSRQLAVVVSPD